MKFAHMGDCHLGGWAHQKLRELNFKSFQLAIDKCIKEKVDFILISGDLFDSPYPSIDTLKESFSEFRKLSDSKIPVFLIAGSHDYSASGKTFLDVLENAGFCKNVSLYEQRQEKIILLPTIHENVAIYGYPGKKSALEIEDIKNIKLQDSPGLFKILMLHTAIRDAVPNPIIPAVDDTKLPKSDYLALSHLHVNYSRNGKVYSGPIFPNNISELEELKQGSFYIFEDGQISKQDIKIKDVVSINIEIKDAFNDTDKIITQLENEKLEDKIVILKVSGILERGKSSDIDFQKIESFVNSKKAYVLLKSITKLHTLESEINLESTNSETLENEIISKFQETKPHTYNSFIKPLIKALHIEKSDDEKSTTFEERLMSEVKRIIDNEDKKD